MIFRILIVITIFNIFLFGVETVRYLIKFRKDLSYFHFITRNYFTTITQTFMILSTIPYAMSVLAFAVCYIITGNFTTLIEYFAK